MLLLLLFVSLVQLALQEVVLSQLKEIEKKSLYILYNILIIDLHSHFSLFITHIIPIISIILLSVQLALQEVVLSQLKGIEKKASSIIFFNEPLSNFEELNYPFKFPYNALEPYVLSESDADR